jgi:hypothetical protein
MLLCADACPKGNHYDNAADLHLAGPGGLGDDVVILLHGHNNREGGHSGGFGWR